MPKKDIIKTTKQRIKEHSLVIERMPGVLHGIWPPANALINVLERELCWEWIYVCFKENKMSLVFSETIMTKLGGKLLEREIANPGNYENMIKEWEKINDDYNKVVEEVDVHCSGAGFKELSTEELKKLYIKFMEALSLAWAIPLTSNNISYCADNIWIPEIIKKYDNKGMEDFTILSTPTELSMMKIEDLELLKIAVEYNKDNDDKKILAKLKKHSEQFHWISNNYRDAVKLDTKYFLEKIKKIEKPEQELENTENEISNFKEKHKTLTKNNQFTKEELISAKLIAQAAILQDRRKKNNLLSMYYIFEFLKEFAKRMDSKRLGYSYKELCYASYPEMKQILDGKKVSRQLLKDRLRCYVELIDIEDDQIVQGKDAEELYELIESSDDVEVDEHGNPKLTELKGIGASLGKAKGVVRVVPDVSKLKEGDFNDGDILIASMTRPEYTPLMRRAGAIVTNEGGISCHAAIVSRELGKPCLIGTKNATKVFRDGDVVEVDADEGIVKKV